MKYYVYNFMSIELIFSCQFLKDNERVRKLIDVLINSSRSFLVSHEKAEEAMVSLALSKLKLVCQSSKTSKPVSTFKLWHQSDIITPFTLKQELINIIVTDSLDVIGDVSDCRNVIFVSQVQDLRDIFAMSIFQLDKKCKMQRIMRISQRRSKENGAREKIQKISLEYDTKKRASQLKIFLNFMRFNTKWYKARIQKCFTLWLIETYEKNIEKTNEIIVKQQHYCRKSKNYLVNKCFRGWKSLTRSHPTSNFNH